MKKNLLLPLSALLLSGTVMAQSGVKPAVIKDKNVRNKAETIAIRHAITGKGMSASTVEPSMQTRAAVNVGTSTYQLQSNSSVQNRIVYNADGTISLAYTFSATGTWGDRGTGYVYNNGTAWSAAPTTRIEPVRTGWPSMMVFGDNSEAVITHNTDASNLYLSRRPVKGTGTWTHNATIIASDAPEGNFWPRAVVGGPTNQSIHLISISNPVDAATDPIFYEGQQGAITYSRSLNGGVTWDKLHVIPSEHDSTQYYGFDGDSYAIDARGNVVAYVVGGFTTDLFLMKSTDNGDTWTKTVIQPFAIPMFEDQISDTTGDGIADTLMANDGALAVLIDNNDDVHVMFGRMRILNNDATDGNISYFPGTAGIMYWNDEDGGNPRMIAGLDDVDGDGVINVAEWGTYQTALTSFPSMGIDASGRIHATFSGIVESTDLLGTGKSARNVYYFSSGDAGDTWDTPRRIEPSEIAEQVWCSVARRADANCVRMVYHSDDAPGHGTTAENVDFDINEGVTAEVFYVCYDPFMGVAESVNVEEMVSLYPNPANTQVHITTIDRITKIEIFNSLGALVGSYAPNATSTNVDVSNFKTGLYTVNVYNGDNKISKTMIKN